MSHVRHGKGQVNTLVDTYLTEQRALQHHPVTPSVTLQREPDRRGIPRCHTCPIISSFDKRGSYAVVRQHDYSTGFDADISAGQTVYTRLMSLCGGASRMKQREGAFFLSPTPGHFAQ